MVARRELDAYVSEISDVRGLLMDALHGALADVDGLSLDEAVRVAVRQAYGVTRAYGDMSALAAAGFYDAARADALPGSIGWRATLAPPPDPAYAGRVFREALGTLGGDVEVTREAVFSALRNPVDQISIGQSRRTIAHNVERDKERPRWAKITVGKTCAWCVMIASRGPVFRYKRSADKSFHGGCDCQAVPFWRGSVNPEGYDLEGMRAKYRAARDEAGSGDPKAVLSAMRRLYHMD